jgi:hypothetical protein
MKKLIFGTLMLMAQLSFAESLTSQFELDFKLCTDLDVSSYDSGANRLSFRDRTPYCQEFRGDLDRQADLAVSALLKELSQLTSTKAALRGEVWMKVTPQQHEAMRDRMKEMLINGKIPEMARIQRFKFERK